MKKDGIKDKKESRAVSKKLFRIRVNPKKSPIKKLTNFSKLSVKAEKKSEVFEIEKMTTKEIENYVKNL